MPIMNNAPFLTGTTYPHYNASNVVLASAGIGIGCDKEPVAEMPAKASRGWCEPGSVSAAKSPESHWVERAGLRTCSY